MTTTAPTVTDALSQAGKFRLSTGKTMLILIVIHEKNQRNRGGRRVHGIDQSVFVLQTIPAGCVTLLASPASPSSPDPLSLSIALVWLLGENSIFAVQHATCCNSN